MEGALGQQTDSTLVFVGKLQSGPGSTPMSASRSLLDEVLPRFDASEVHDTWYRHERRSCSRR
jgi:hypothetical protein